jgi:hypothetical protein
MGGRERGRGVRDRISEWTHGPDWKTWVAHTVFGLLIAVVVGVIAALLGRRWEFYGAAVAIGYYLIREIEQVVYDLVDKKPVAPKAFDHFMDVAVPAVFVTALAALGAWLA